MSTKTSIEWTDATWNPTTGCTKVSPGCKHCYASEQMWPRLSLMPKTIYFGRKFTDVHTHPLRLAEPFSWVKPRKVFVDSMSDLFHDDIPFEFIAQVFWVMGVTSRHTYQVLTKRPQRMLEFFTWAADNGGLWQDERITDSAPPDIEWRPVSKTRGGYDNCGPAWPYKNVWLGVSVENQETANERIPLLLQVPAAVRWISAEPLLGPVTLFDLDGPIDIPEGGKSPLQWVVVGGESGHGARPMHPEWAYSLRDQCQSAGVPFLFKQWGEWISPGSEGYGVLKGEIRHIKSDGSDWGDELPPDEDADVVTVKRVGSGKAGRVLGGRLWDEFPTIAKVGAV